MNTKNAEEEEAELDRIRKRAPVRITRPTERESFSYEREYSSSYIKAEEGRRRRTTCDNGMLLEEPWRPLNTLNGPSTSHSRLSFYDLRQTTDKVDDIFDVVRSKQQKNTIQPPPPPSTPVTMTDRGEMGRFTEGLARYLRTPNIAAPIKDNLGCLFTPKRNSGPSATGKGSVYGRELSSPITSHAPSITPSSSYGDKKEPITLCNDMEDILFSKTPSSSKHKNATLLTVPDLSCNEESASLQAGSPKRNAASATSTSDLRLLHKINEIMMGKEILKGDGIDSEQIYMETSPLHGQIIFQKGSITVNSFKFYLENVHHAHVPYGYIWEWRKGPILILNSTRFLPYLGIFLRKKVQVKSVKGVIFENIAKWGNLHLDGNPIVRLVFDPNTSSRKRVLLQDLLLRFLRYKIKLLTVFQEYCSEGGLNDGQMSAQPPLRVYRTRSRTLTLSSDSQTEREDSVAVLPNRSAIPTLESKPRLLFLYPPNSADAIEITTNELLRIPEGVYLNDSLIDLDLRYTLATKVSKSVQERTHIFSCFFYRKLVDCMTRKMDFINLTKLNMFERDFLFVPINEHMHWYLALIFNPSAVLIQANGTAPTITLDSTQSTGEEEEALLTQERTYIVIFDSLGSRQRRSAVERLKSFIIQDARTRYGVEVSKRDISSLFAKVPLQVNLTDCGCFLLQYAEKFLCAPEECMQRILAREDLSQWFTADDATARRLALRELIDKLALEYSKAEPQSTTPHLSTSSDIEEIL